MTKIEEIQTVRTAIEKLQEELKRLQFEADAPKRAKRVNQFLSGYTGKKLLEKHSLTDFGIWEVRGEDPNCDLAGPHFTPYIGTKEGTLQNVIEWAVAQDRFWTWGGGGGITKLKV